MTIKKKLYASAIRKAQEDDGWIYPHDVPSMVTLYPNDLTKRRDLRTQHKLGRRGKGVRGKGGPYE